MTEDLIIYHQINSQWSKAHISFILDWYCFFCSFPEFEKAIHNWNHKNVLLRRRKVQFSYHNHESTVQMLEKLFSFLRIQLKQTLILISIAQLESNTYSLPHHLLQDLLHSFILPNQLRILLNHLLLHDFYVLMHQKQIDHFFLLRHSQFLVTLLPDTLLEPVPRYNFLFDPIVKGY